MVKNNAEKCSITKPLSSSKEWGEDREAEYIKEKKYPKHVIICKQMLTMQVPFEYWSKEYVSLIIGLYKNNGSVLHVAVQNLKSNCTMVYGNMLPLPCYPVGWVFIMGRYW